MHEKLKVAREQSESLLSLHKQRLLEITKTILKDHAKFEEGGFYLHTVPEGVNAASDWYTLILNKDHEEGWLWAKIFTVESFDTIDEIPLSCVTDAGKIVEPEAARGLF